MAFIDLTSCFLKNDKNVPLMLFLYCCALSTDLLFDGGQFLGLTLIISPSRLIVFPYSCSQRSRLQYIDSGIREQLHACMFGYMYQLSGWEECRDSADRRHRKLTRRDLHLYLITQTSLALTLLPSPFPFKTNFVDWLSNSDCRDS